jgi:hypothetical protein
MTMTENLDSTHFAGFYKIWRVHKETGEKELLVDNKNLILYGGSDLLALSLGGFRNAKISNMYIGYLNIATGSPITPTTIDKSYSVPFSYYGQPGAHEDKGYIRAPLAYAPTYQASTSDYDSNQVIFTSVISANQESTSGADFLFADDVSLTPSHIFEIALAAALDPATASSDIIFSRASFTPITYDQNYNLSISWGIQFLS